MTRRAIDRQRHWSSVDAGLWVFLMGTVAITALIGYCELVGYYAPLRP